MICIDVMLILFGIYPQNDWIHSVQVWVSGYELHWNNEMTPTCLLKNTPADMIRHYVMWIDAALPLKIIGPTLIRYEFQVINHVRIVKWRLHVLLMNTTTDMIRHDIMWIYVALPLKIIGPIVCRYEFQVMNCIGIIKWHLHVYQLIHHWIWTAKM